MTPLKALVGVVSLLSEMVAREYGRVQFPHWPDGEAPLVDGGIADTVWATMPRQVSAGSAIEARVDAPADEVPTPGRAHTPGVGHLTSAPRDCSCDEHTDAYLYDPGHHPACISRLPKVTASLLISASIGLRDYADSDACEAPVYWRSIASQLDPNERKS